MAATGSVSKAAGSMMAPDAVVRKWKGVTAILLSTQAVINASNSVRSLMRRVIAMGGGIGGAPEWQESLAAWMRDIRDGIKIAEVRRSWTG